MACLLVRGTEHPHTGDVGKMVSALEDLRSGGETEQTHVKESGTQI